jgi:acyl carrier protein phosphodiesterase
MAGVHQGHRGPRRLRRVLGAAGIEEDRVSDYFIETCWDQGRECYVAEVIEVATGRVMHSCAARFQRNAELNARLWLTLHEVEMCVSRMG